MNALKIVLVLAILAISVVNVQAAYNDVAILYKFVSDTNPYRTPAEVAEIANNAKADIIFSAGWKSDFPITLPNWNRWSTNISQLKSNLSNSNTKIVSGISCRHAGTIQGEKDPITGASISPAIVSSWVLNFSKHPDWGLSQAQQNAFWNNYSSNTTFMDITNESYRKLMLNISKGFIDNGSNVIWLDGLFSQARGLGEILGNTNQSAIDSYNNATWLIDQIHTYNASIEIISWVEEGYQDWGVPDLDYLLFSPTATEVRDETWNTARWNLAEACSGGKEMWVFFDYDSALNTTPIMYLQEKTIEEQEDYLATFDAYCSSRNMTFIYPVHGADFGTAAGNLSYGTYYLYDALAPEFSTYEEIKALAQLKKYNETGGDFTVFCPLRLKNQLLDVDANSKLYICNDLTLINSTVATDAIHIAPSMWIAKDSDSRIEVRP